MKKCVQVQMQMQLEFLQDERQAASTPVSSGAFNFFLKAI